MQKRTKIVATIGLASESEEMLKSLIKAGMNVARLNFSHGSHEWHAAVIKRIRQIAEELDLSIGILADLQGPRIRTVVSEELELSKGEKVLVSDVFASQLEVNDQKIIKLDAPGIIRDIEVGNEILIEDGLIKLVVRKKKGTSMLETEVIDAGMVKNHKGVNIPDAKLQISPITEKDEADLKFSLEKGVDFVALSFVSTGGDIETLRGKIKAQLNREHDLPQIVAKIERKEAIKNLPEIITATDAVMVARGDLGIEEEGAKVTILQKRIIDESLRQMKPVIVATQMLNSMIENPRPTRAEVSDVTNAVIDHADAVMLSGESASGKFPVDAVSTMAEIIAEVEKSSLDDTYEAYKGQGAEDYAALLKNAAELAEEAKARAVLLATVSGFSARLISHYRPKKPIFVASNSKAAYNQMSLIWGIEGHYFEDPYLDNSLDLLLEKIENQGRVKKGDKVVMIKGRSAKGEKMRILGVREV